MQSGKAEAAFVNDEKLRKGPQLGDVLVGSGLPEERVKTADPVDDRKYVGFRVEGNFSFKGSVEGSLKSGAFGGLRPLGFRDG